MIFLQKSSIFKAQIQVEPIRITGYSSLLGTFLAGSPKFYRVQPRTADLDLHMWKGSTHGGKMILIYAKGPLECEKSWMFFSESIATYMIKKTTIFVIRLLFGSSFFGDDCFGFSVGGPIDFRKLLDRTTAGHWRWFPSSFDGCCWGAGLKGTWSKLLWVLMYECLCSITMIYDDAVWFICEFMM